MPGHEIKSIAEVVGVDDDRVKTQDIFIFDRSGVNEAGKVQGRFRWTDYQPKILDRFRMMGIALPDTLLQEVVNVNL